MKTPMTRAGSASGELARTHCTRTLAFVAVAAVSVAALLVPGPAATAAMVGPATAPPTGGAATTTAATGPAPVLGVYAGAAYPAAVRHFAVTLGQQPHFAMDFLNGSTWPTITQPTWPYSKWKGKGYTMIWGLNMLPDTYSANSDPTVAQGSCSGITQGSKGTFDHYFRTVGENMVRNGFARSIVRPAWEFNGNWFPWAAEGCASAFVRYFDDIVATMRSVPGAHFTFEWNPTRGDLGVGNLSQYYPGNAYIDYVGLDVYDLEGPNYPGARAEFRHMLTQTDGLDWLASFAASHHKPIVLPEWGLGWGTCSASGRPISASSGPTCGGDDATWVNLMAGWIATHNVFEATYWDFGTSTLDHRGNPLVAAALVKNFVDPH